MNKRFLKNIAFDFAVVYPAMATYFFIGGLSEYAENALSFLGILCLFVGVTGIFLIDKIAENKKKSGEVKRSRAHAFYVNLSTIFEVVVFAMLGWYWVAVGFLLAAVIASMVDDRM